MVRWLRWHCPPDTGFEIRALAVWGRARYLSDTEAPHNTDFHTWMGKKHLCFFQTADTGKRTPNSGVKGSGANHYPRAPAHTHSWQRHCDDLRVQGSYLFPHKCLFWLEWGQLGSETRFHPMDTSGCLFEDKWLGIDGLPQDYKINLALIRKIIMFFLT